MKGHSPPSADWALIEGEAGVLDPIYTYGRVKVNHLVGSAIAAHCRGIRDSLALPVPPPHGE